MGLGAIHMPPAGMAAELPANPKYPSLRPNLQLAYFPHFGPMCFDFSPRRKHIASVNGDPSYVMTRAGRMWSFDGVGDYIDTGDVGAVNTTGSDFSFVAWHDFMGANPLADGNVYGTGDTGLTNRNFIYSTGIVGSTMKWRLHIEDDASVALSRQLSTAVEVADGPHCISVSVDYSDGSLWRMFIDGVNQSHDSAAGGSLGTFGPTTHSLFLGAENREGYAASLATFGIGTFLWYDRLLTSAEHRIHGLDPFALLRTA